MLESIRLVILAREEIWKEATNLVVALPRCLLRDVL